jgi:cation:H+ antiporter
VFWILGASAIMRPLPFSAANLSDTLVAIGASLLLFFAMFVGRRHLLERWQAASFIGLYAVYVAAIVIGQ